MKGPQGFVMFMNIVLNLVLGLIVSAAMQLYAAGSINGASLASSMLLSFVIGFTAGSLIPAMNWGYAIAGKLGLKSGSFLEYIAVSVTLGICMGTVICCYCSLVNNIPLGATAVWGFIAHFCPFICLVASACVFVFLKPAMALGIKVSGFNPAAAPAPEAE